MAIKTKLQLKSRALVYVPLCRGNHIAAALFDWVLTFSEIEVRLRYKDPFYVYVESAGGPLGNPGPFLEYFGYKVGVDGELEVTLADLRAVVAPQLLPLPSAADQAVALQRPVLPSVPDQEIWEALDFLSESRLVSWYILSADNASRSPSSVITINSLFLDHLDNDVAFFHHGYRVTEEKPLYEATRERRIVREQRSRAGRIGQPASLTFEEWIETLMYFNGHCAFSADHPYEVLEHFIPVTYGGGTTVFNCIPACQRCNAIKADRLPVDLRETPLGESLSRVQEYLEKRREQWLKKHGQM